MRQPGRKLKAIDLYCKAGGASMGLYRAGFEVTGVDIEPQKNYPFKFIQADALTVDLSGFDFVWASPPCQAHTSLKGAAWDKKSYVEKHPDLIPATRQKLQRSGLPYIIENVQGAPLFMPILLCGSHFNLSTKQGHQLRRHRLFESNFLIMSPGLCIHTTPTIGIFGNKARDTGAEKRHYSQPKLSRGTPPSGILLTLRDAQEAMGIDWMNQKEMSQAIPPIYAEFLGKRIHEAIMAKYLN